MTLLEPPPTDTYPEAEAPSVEALEEMLAGPKVTPGVAKLDGYSGSEAPWTTSTMTFTLDPDPNPFDLPLAPVPDLGRRVPEPDRSTELTFQRYFTETLDYIRSTQRSALPVDDPSGPALCLYRNREGLRCAVGHWIPDGHQAFMATGDAEALANRWPELEGIAWPANGVDLALDLQRLHDDRHGRGPGDFGLNSAGEDHAQRIAAQYGLIYHPPS